MRRPDSAHTPQAPLRSGGIQETRVDGVETVKRSLLRNFQNIIGCLSERPANGFNGVAGALSDECWEECVEELSDGLTEDITKAFVEEFCEEYPEESLNESAETSACETSANTFCCVCIELCPSFSRRRS